MKPGEWVRMSYKGKDTDEVYLAVSDEIPDDKDWLPAFFEAGDVMVRCPELPRGAYFLWVRVNGEAPYRGNTVEVV